MISACYYENSDLSLPSDDNINANSQMLPASGCSIDSINVKYMLADNSLSFNSPAGHTPTTEAPASKQSNTKQATKAKDRKPTSYIMNRFPVNWRLYSYLIVLVKGFNKPTREFWFHVLACSLLPQNLKEEEWIPVPRETINKEWGKKGEAHRKVDIEGLIQAGLLERDYYSIENGKCYYYTIPSNILMGCMGFYYILEPQIQAIDFYNLMTGKKIEKFKGSKLYDENRHPLPELVSSAIKGMKRHVFHLAQVEAQLAKAQAGIQNKPQLNRKYANDARCFELIARRCRPIGNGLVEYIPIYEHQKYGRITEKEGGLQSCSRAMKKAAFSFPNCYNYDLKSSQMYILKWWFEKANVCTQFIDNYLASDKAEWAKEIGISVDCLKNCMYAKFFGASSTSEYWDYKAGKYKQESFEKAVPHYIWEEARRQLESKNITNEDEVDRLALILLNKFTVFVRPLDLELKKFYKWLVFTYCKGKKRVKNLTGMTFDLEEYQDKGNYPKKNLSTLNRKLTSFFLQGTEAAFIHFLTTEEVQTKYSYEVISNQHDGLVTIGQVSKDAVQEAKEHFGIAYFDLVEKDICSKEEENWWLST
ncbi:MAG: hypothetical protein KME29_15795 [Calothrix sp. FI2-JRJ7]|nr:hypothetical protein [Calothrix sp. FI2-JRJ7]